VREKVNILMEVDQPSKLMSYEMILGEFGGSLHVAANHSPPLGLLASP
jgi:hypothetical protein